MRGQVAKWWNCASGALKMSRTRSFTTPRKNYGKRGGEADACQYVENVNHWCPEKVLGNRLVQGKQVQRFVTRSSSFGARGGDRRRKRYRNQWDHVGRKRKSRRESGEKVANSTNVVPYEEHLLETKCGRQWLLEEYLGEDMMPRGFSHCIKVVARSLTSRHVMGPVDGRWSS